MLRLCLFWLCIDGLSRGLIESWPGCVCVMPAVIQRLDVTASGAIAVLLTFSVTSRQNFLSGSL